MRYNEREQRIMQEAAVRERKRMAEKAAYYAGRRTLRDLADSSRGAAADLRRAADEHLFARSPELTGAQRAAIDRDFAAIARFKSGKVAPAPLPADLPPAAKAYIERSRARVAAEPSRFSLPTYSIGNRTRDQ